MRERSSLLKNDSADARVERQNRTKLMLGYIHMSYIGTQWRLVLAEVSDNALLILFSTRTNLCTSLNLAPRVACGGQAPTEVLRLRSA